MTRTTLELELPSQKVRTGRRSSTKSDLKCTRTYSRTRSSSYIICHLKSSTRIFYVVLLQVLISFVRCYPDTFKLSSLGSAISVMFRVKSHQEKKEWACKKLIARICNISFCFIYREKKYVNSLLQSS
ncbi:hypothetical protein AVEN_140942-1 [Araneus ventricosus]|uniref:Uncharacterized protein n=1 Tax=Araneus ventricosus TaxID=182803 RepID=A0A4Y2GB36_ARAVE|nr:hypothetical protein AVEN_140942-1 [Araneus ventricosus]